MSNKTRIEQIEEFYNLDMPQEGLPYYRDGGFDFLSLNRMFNDSIEIENHNIRLKGDQNLGYNLYYGFDKNGDKGFYPIKNLLDLDRFYLEINEFDLEDKMLFQNKNGLFSTTIEEFNKYLSSMYLSFDKRQILTYDQIDTLAHNLHPVLQNMNLSSGTGGTGGTGTINNTVLANHIANKTIHTNSIEKRYWDAAASWIEKNTTKDSANNSINLGHVYHEKYYRKDIAQYVIGEAYFQNVLHGIGSFLLGANGKKYLQSRSDATEIGMNLRTKTFRSGFLGEGTMLDIEKNKLELDELVVRKTALFYELVIQKIRHQGGILILSPASLKVSNFTDLETEVKVYFDTDNDTISQSFVKGDLARCQTWTGKGIKYYWSEVIEIGRDYIILSKEKCDGLLNVSLGDEIVQLGNIDNKERQNAILISSMGESNPCMDMHSGINSFTLEGTLSQRTGNLKGIVDNVFGKLEGMGMIAENVYLKGKFALSNNNLIEDELGRIDTGLHNIDGRLLDIDNILVSKASTTFVNDKIQEIKDVDIKQQKTIIEKNIEGIQKLYDAQIAFEKAYEKANLDGRITDSEKKNLGALKNVWDQVLQEILRLRAKTVCKFDFNKELVDRCGIVLGDTKKIISDTNGTYLHIEDSFNSLNFMPFVEVDTDRIYRVSIKIRGNNSKCYVGVACYDHNKKLLQGASFNYCTLVSALDDNENFHIYTGNITDQQKLFVRHGTFQQGTKYIVPCILVNYNKEVEGITNADILYYKIEDITEVEKAKEFSNANLLDYQQKANDDLNSAKQEIQEKINTKITPSAVDEKLRLKSLEIESAYQEYLRRQETLSYLFDQALSDGRITKEEKEAIKKANENLELAKLDYKNRIEQVGELIEKIQENTLPELQKSLETYTRLEKQRAIEIANAYSDGKITSAEQRIIDSANQAVAKEGERLEELMRFLDLGATNLLEDSQKTRVAQNGIIAIDVYQALKQCKGDKVTISFYTNAKESDNIQIAAKGKYYFETATTVTTQEDQRVFFTVDISINDQSLDTSFIEVSNKDDVSLKIHKIKIEVGDNMTDWSPSLKELPKYIESVVRPEITRLDSSITQNSNQITLQASRVDKIVDAQSGLMTDIASNRSSIAQNADLISLKVDSATYDNNAKSTSEMLEKLKQISGVNLFDEFIGEKSISNQFTEKIFYSRLPYQEFKTGDWVTISAYVKCDKKDFCLGIVYTHKDGSFKMYRSDSLTKTNQYEKLVFTKYLDDKFESIEFYVLNNSIVAEYTLSIKDVKVEKGQIATPYTVSPKFLINQAKLQSEQYADRLQETLLNIDIENPDTGNELAKLFERYRQSINNSTQEIIDNLEIGGENLLLDSAYFKFDGTDYQNSDRTKNNKITITRKKKQGEEERYNGWAFVELPSCPDPRGIKLVLSLEIKVSEGLQDCIVAFDTREPVIKRQKNIDCENHHWQKVFIVLPTPINHQYKTRIDYVISFFGRIIGSTATVEYRHVKIEKGVVPTAYSINPLDLKTDLQKYSDAQSRLQAEKVKALLDGKITSSEQKAIYRAEEMERKAKEKAMEAISSMSVGARNLIIFNPRNIEAYGNEENVKFNGLQVDFNHHINEGDNGVGICLKDEIFLANTSYVLQFTITNLSDLPFDYMGGHLGNGYIQDSLTFNGEVVNGNFHESIPCDLKKGKSIDVVLKFHTIEYHVSHVYIQPLRIHYKSVECSITKLKLEKGTIATDYSESPEDILFINSNNLDTLIGQNSNAGINLWRNGIEELKNTSEYCGVDVRKWHDWKKDTYYTISFDHKVSKNGKLKFYANQTLLIPKYAFFDSTTQWQHKEITFKIANTDPSKKIVISWYGTYGTGVNPTIKNIKLEEGTHATVWTPSAWDVQNSIDTVKEFATSKFNVANQKIESTVASIKVLQGDNQKIKTDVSNIKQTSDSIQTTVSDMQSSVSSIRQTANDLTAKIVDKDKVVALINASNEGVKIDANKINLTGRVSALGMSLQQMFNKINDGYGDISRSHTEIRNSVQQLQDSLTDGINLLFEEDCRTGGISISKIFPDSLDSHGKYTIQFMAYRTNTPIKNHISDKNCVGCIDIKVNYTNGSTKEFRVGNFVLITNKKYTYTIDKPYDYFYNLNCRVKEAFLYIRQGIGYKFVIDRIQLERGLKSTPYKRSIYTPIFTTVNFERNISNIDSTLSHVKGDITSLTSALNQTVSDSDLQLAMDQRTGEVMGVYNEVYKLRTTRGRFIGPNSSSLEEALISIKSIQKEIDQINYRNCHGGISSAERTRSCFIESRVSTKKERDKILQSRIYRGYR